MSLITLAETARALEEIAILNGNPGYSLDVVRAVNYGINNRISNPLCTQVMNIASIYYIDNVADLEGPKKSYNTSKANKGTEEEKERLAFNREAKRKAMAEGADQFHGKCHIHKLTVFILYAARTHRCLKCDRARYNIKKPKSISVEEMEVAA